LYEPSGGGITFIHVVCTKAAAKSHADDEGKSLKEEQAEVTVDG